MILANTLILTTTTAHLFIKSVEDVTGKEIRALLRGADVKILVGCAPCQPFSSHQKDKQNRSKHKDWKLLYQFGRLVEETRPHIVSMENVPELEKEKVYELAKKISVRRLFCRRRTYYLYRKWKESCT